MEHEFDHFTGQTGFDITYRIGENTKKNNINYLNLHKKIIKVNEFLIILEFIFSLHNENNPLRRPAWEGSR